MCGDIGGRLSGRAIPTRQDRAAVAEAFWDKVSTMGCLHRGPLCHRHVSLKHPGVRCLGVIGANHRGSGSSRGASGAGDQVLGRTRAMCQVLVGTGAGQHDPGQEGLVTSWGGGEEGAPQAVREVKALVGPGVHGQKGGRGGLEWTPSATRRALVFAPRSPTSATRHGTDEGVRSLGTSLQWRSTGLALWGLLQRPDFMAGQGWGPGGSGAWHKVESGWSELHRDRWPCRVSPGAGWRGCRHHMVSMVPYQAPGGQLQGTTRGAATVQKGPWAAQPPPRWPQQKRSQRGPFRVQQMSWPRRWPGVCTATASPGPRRNLWSREDRAARG